MTDAYIDVRCLNKWYGRFHALRHIDLTVGRGERLAICGPSGSGKSTLIRCLNGLEAHDSGTIRIGPLELDGDPAHIQAVRRDVGLVFQQFNLFPHLTVLDNCTLAPIHALKMSAREARALALHYLERVRAADQAAKYPGALSGGQQQRVAIARALTMSPSVLLFDEPTSALDPEMAGEVLDTILSLAHDGRTVLCVTHEMAFARELADRVVFMEDGRILEVAGGAAFFDRPRHARARSFLASRRARPKGTVLLRPT